MPSIAPGPALTATERDRLWADLAADDAGKAWRALGRLADSPADALAVLRERLTPTPAPDHARVRALIADLAAADFARREAATRSLSLFADLIEPELRAALARAERPSQSRRLKALLDQPPTLRNPERDPPLAQPVTLLEPIHTPETRLLLQRPLRKAQTSQHKSNSTRGDPEAHLHILSLNNDLQHHSLTPGQGGSLTQTIWCHRLAAKQSVRTMTSPIYEIEAAPPRQAACTLHALPVQARFRLAASRRRLRNPPVPSACR